MGAFAASGHEQRGTAAEDDIDALFGDKGLGTDNIGDGEDARAAANHEANQEARHPIILTSPCRPSADDVEKHNATHLPYRNWCPVCVRARGKEDAHRRRHGDGLARRRDGLAKILMDYQELKSKPKKDPSPDDKVVKIIVEKDEPTGMVFAHRVESKGPSDPWIANRIVQDIEELGRRDVILKTDGEPAIVALQRTVAAQRQGITKPENPPAYNPSSNGACEKAVQDVSNLVRETCA